jgi:hypothetical protein
MSAGDQNYSRAALFKCLSDGSTIRLDSFNYGGQTLEVRVTITLSVRVL